MPLCVCVWVCMCATCARDFFYFQVHVLYNVQFRCSIIVCELILCLCIISLHYRSQSHSAAASMATISQVPVEHGSLLYNTRLVMESHARVLSRLYNAVCLSLVFTVQCNKCMLCQFV